MEKSEPVTISKAVWQGVAIARKNLHNSLSNKKRLLGELFLPLLVSAAYIGTESTSPITQS